MCAFLMLIRSLCFVDWASRPNEGIEKPFELNILAILLQYGLSDLRLAFRRSMAECDLSPLCEFRARGCALFGYRFALYNLLFYVTRCPSSARAHSSGVQSPRKPYRDRSEPLRRAQGTNMFCVLVGFVTPLS